jgi:quercetin dioxygenase-like cupin family protein
MVEVIRAEPAHSFVYDGARMNIFHVNKGEGLPKHDHNFAHGTVCMSGSCMIRKEGKEVVIDKFTQPLNLVANEWHEIEALEDNTVFCNIFAEGKY